MAGTSRWYEVLDLIAKLSLALAIPTILAAFAWARAADGRMTVVEVRQQAVMTQLDRIADRFDAGDKRDAELLGAISDLRVQIAGMR